MSERTDMAEAIELLCWRRLYDLRDKRLERSSWHIDGARAAAESARAFAAEVVRKAQALEDAIQLREDLLRKDEEAK